MRLQVTYRRLARYPCGVDGVADRLIAAVARASRGGDAIWVASAPAGVLALATFGFASGPISYRTGVSSSLTGLRCSATSLERPSVLRVNACFFVGVVCCDRGAAVLQPIPRATGSPKSNPTQGQRELSASELQLVRLSSVASQVPQRISMSKHATVALDSNIVALRVEVACGPVPVNPSAH